MRSFVLAGFVATLGLLVTQPAAANNVILFGGSQSRAAVVGKCYAGVKAFGYPASGAQVSWAVNQIVSNPSKKFVVAGHSSGAKYANQVATQAALKLAANGVQKPNFILVNLDGFTPKNVPKSVRRICWKATNGRGLLSKNGHLMTRSNSCGEVKTHTAPHCSTQWCLHFTLVNLRTPGGLVNWVGEGYANCSPNRKWIE